MSIYDEYKRYPDVHPTIILKTDVVRQGIAISKRATEQFAQMDNVAWRGYHMFSYNRQETQVISDKLPFALCLEDVTNVACGLALAAARAHGTDGYQRHSGLQGRGLGAHQPEVSTSS